MSLLPLWLLITIFAAAGTVVWFAGIQLSKTTDIIDSRFHLGSALGGLIVLAVATNLPEIAITVSAAISGNVDVAVGNILGGIALQTVVLVALDAFGKRGKDVKPLTYRAASLTLVLEAMVVIAVLAVVVAGSQLPSTLVFLRLAPAGVLIAALWVTGLLLVRRAGAGLPWHENGNAPASSRHQGGHRNRTSSSNPDASGSGGGTKMSTGTAVAMFAVSAVATLVAGVVLEVSGDAAANQLGVSGIIFGATILALATSLPELSTGLQSIKQGDDNLAMSDIFGGNAFLPVLFLIATVISGKAVLPSASATDIYLTALGILLTFVYAIGLIFRPMRKIASMGVDSVAVLCLYLVGIAGLFTIVS
ncbi:MULTISPECIES: sodium:calcium antiporter [unclassified Cryobacterium]|uniref:sodium:calcium antiporter n=1 Tax=unclassified Cryobacterium TaxID=2649013 RepID=UPI002AB5148A|nr:MULTISPECIES: sodium:calcium antiporter [unclassified Cryobacterium]MDY7543768.1 sodium:calcium antiporter [Cryobacterium sp. 5B3]MEA9997574.1 sodium:calcium antiporter [Cryobacterium sp. RTS3]MEB0273443.1 sodium:calcium antiporter [Cryobacterium sp. 5B3]